MSNTHFVGLQIIGFVQIRFLRRLDFKSSCHRPGKFELEAQDLKAFSDISAWGRAAWRKTCTKRQAADQIPGANDSRLSKRFQDI